MKRILTVKKVTRRIIADPRTGALIPRKYRVFEPVEVEAPVLGQSALAKFIALAEGN